MAALLLGTEAMANVLHFAVGYAIGYIGARCGFWYVRQLVTALSRQAGMRRG